MIHRRDVLARQPGWISFDLQFSVSGVAVPPGSRRVGAGSMAGRGGPFWLQGLDGLVMAAAGPGCG
jgi:hypothetical protein